MKKEKFYELLNSMKNCEECIYLKSSKGKDYSLINIYSNGEFCKNIPSIWTDWLNRLDAKIMIIGQDWGPFLDMEKLHELYQKDPTKTNWKYLINQEKSSTKKLLELYIKESSNGEYSLDDMYITNAIMCARKGTSYRGNNINLKVSSRNCSKYLQSQIDIVKPKVILTLGYYSLYALSKIYDFNIDNTLKDAIDSNPEIKTNGFVIIPLYHPVAQIKKSEQLKQYRRIWKYIHK